MKTKLTLKNYKREAMKRPSFRKEYERFDPLMELSLLWTRIKVWLGRFLVVALSLMLLGGCTEISEKKPNFNAVTEVYVGMKQCLRACAEMNVYYPGEKTDDSMISDSVMGGGTLYNACRQDCTTEYIRLQGNLHCPE